MSSRPRPRLVVALGVAVASLAAVLITAGGASARPARAGSTCTAPAATAARLQVQVTSSARQLDVHVAPGQVTGRRDGATSGGATTGYVADGVRVSVPAGATGKVVTQIVSVDPTRAGTITVKLDKTSGGNATVTVASASGYGKAVTVSVKGTSTTAQVSVPRSQLFDPSYALPKADDRKLVLAAYYPWFTVAGYDSALLAEKPLDPRSVWSADGVLSMTQQARSAGVDGFVVSWMGAEKHGSAFDAAAAAATQVGNVVAPYLETSEALGHGGLATVEQWLREAVDRTGPASLTVEGAPVVFVWDMAQVGAADWTAMLARLDRPVKLVGDADTGTHGSVMRGWHAYLPPTDLTGAATRNAFRSGWYRGAAALDSTLRPFLHVATVSPGFDDRNLRGADRPVVSREGGRYGATWDAALAGDPDMVLITSWNEWYEGSEIEPGTRWGATALGETATRSATWKAPVASCTPTSTTDSSTRTKASKGR